jgi:hypothetical protein
MGQAGPLAARAGPAVVVTVARVATARATTTSSVVASLCFTRLSLSAVRRTLDGHEYDPMLLGRVVLDFVRLAKRVTEFKGRAALPSSRSKGAATTRSR